MSSNVQIKPVADYGSGLCQPGAPIVLVHENGEITLQHTGEQPLAVRAKIQQLVRALEVSDGYFKQLPLEHQFANGMYIRRLFIPKGSLIVGRIHKHECVNVVEKGDISVLTETGMKRVQAGFTIVSPPGIQKVGYAHEDTVFTNIFRTDETDVDKIEDVLTWASYEAMESPALDVHDTEREQICQ
jgi:quercetin dioxygenase-like cupin family protein